MFPDHPAYETVCTRGGYLDLNAGPCVTLALDLGVGTSDPWGCLSAPFTWPTLRGPIGTQGQTVS